MTTRLINMDGKWMEIEWALGFLKPLNYEWPSEYVLNIKSVLFPDNLPHRIGTDQNTAVVSKIKSWFDLNRDLIPFAIRFERYWIRFERVAIPFDSIWTSRDSVWPCGDLANKSLLQALNLKRPVSSAINCFVEDILYRFVKPNKCK